MTAIQLLTCAGMIVDASLILGLEPAEFTSSLFASLLWKKSSIREDIWASTDRKKADPLERGIMKAQTVLEMTRRSRRLSLVCTASLALFCTGGSIVILLDNFFTTLVLAAGPMPLPSRYVKLTVNHYKKDIAAELETAPSVVVAIYLRTEDIVTTVNENIVYLNPPVSRVFRELPMQVRLVNLGVEAALRTMKSRVDNEVFRE